MPYVDPKTVLSPKSKVRSVSVIYDSGPGKGSWSVALLRWGDYERVGMRWNGDEEDDRGPLGNPQSHGRPTWFVVPEELAAHVREAAEQLTHGGETGLLAAYRDMARDKQREADAHEWSEGLIGSGFEEEEREKPGFPPVHQKRRRTRAS